MQSSTGPERIRVSISMPPDLLEKLDSVRGGLPRSRVVSELVREFLEKREATQEEGA